MTISFAAFFTQLTSNLPFCMTTVLTLGVILVNGWTDAPNAIATCVSIRAITPRRAILLAAACNFAGLLLMTRLNASVAETIYNIADFGGDPQDANIALCAAMFAIVLWATFAWAFGIPTSESHALIAGISGAAVALHGDSSGIHWDEWGKALYGLLLSTALGFVLGYLCTKAMQRLFHRADRKKTAGFFQKAQIFGGGATAFLHGAQDGQKFMGIFMLGIFLAKGQGNVSHFQIPVWMMLLCAAVMALGTSVGGYKIIKSVGMDMVKLEAYQGFAADLASAACLLLSSLTGVPVSTTHTKTTAILGVGAARRFSCVHWGVAKEMALAWALTFPGCGVVGFLMARVFLHIF